MVETIHSREAGMPFAAGKAPTFRLTPLTALIQAALLGLPVAAVAGPEGGVVAAGTGTIARPDARTTNIHQGSQNLILNWDSYNIRANETVNYRQPNANAQALNRIHSQSPSHIYGRLNANGQVLLVNPNGVFFKPGARVNVGGLMASGLNITDQDFLAGKYHFKHAGDTAPGAVVNQGVIQAATGGSVSLIGGAVKNAGRILAHAGQVNLVAGKAMAMDFDGDGLMRFTVSEALLKKTEGLAHAVSNTGAIEAGAVLLKGRAARAVFSEVVNNSGVIGAARVDNKGGVIRLVAGGSTGSPTGGNSLINTGTLRAAGGTIELKAEGKAEVSGKAHISTASKTGRGGQIDITGQEVRIAGQARLDASSAAPAARAGGAVKVKAQNKAVVTGQARISATSKAGQGGQIEITGEKVGLMGLAQLDVSGAMGGGQILAGGDYQGKNPAIRNAKVTYVGKKVKLAADATRNGKGGRVIVWADDTTRYYGAISAKGGALGGDGGFVEVSGKRHLAFRGEVSVSAAKGRAGTLLLDPNDLCIGGSATSNSCGGSTDNPTPSDTTNPFDAASSTANSWVSQATLSGLGNVNIILQANNDIFFDSNISLGDGFTRQFRLIAGRDINMKGKSLTLSGAGASARFYAGRDIQLGNVSVPSGSIRLSANRTVTQAPGSALVANTLWLNHPRVSNQGTGDFDGAENYTGTYTLTNNNQISSLNLGGALGGDLSFKNTGAFNLVGPVNNNGHRITLESAGDITQDQNAAISGAGGLTKRGTGNLKLTAYNLYTGETRVEGGTLELDGARTGRIVNVLARSAVDLAASTTLVVKQSQTIGGLLSNQKSSEVQIPKGQTLTINNPASADHTFDGLIKETGTGDTRANLVKEGTGQLTLTSANAYRGTTTISGGRLRIENTGALGPTTGEAGRVTVEKYGSLIFYLPTTTSGFPQFTKNLRLAGPGALTDPTKSESATNPRLGALRLVSGGATATTLSGTITLTGAATIINAVSNRELQINADLSLQGGSASAPYHLTLGGAGDIVISRGGQTEFKPAEKGLITGSGDLIKTGAGRLTLNKHRGADNTHTGTIRVKGGTLQLNTERAISTASKLVVDGGTFNMSNRSAEFSGVELKRGRITGNATSATLTLNDKSATEKRFFILRSGTIRGVRLAGTAGLKKRSDHTSGHGTVVLNADTGNSTRAMNYRGAVTVDKGTLLARGDNSLRNGGEITINKDGILEIEEPGTIDGDGTVAAYNSITLNLNGGTLRLSSTLASGSRTYRLSNTINLWADSIIETRNKADALGSSDWFSANTWNLTGNLNLQSGSRDAIKAHTLTLNTIASLHGANNNWRRSDLVLSGKISGRGGLKKTGVGRLTLSNANNDYTGKTEVEGATSGCGACRGNVIRGELRLGGNNAISPNSRLIIDQGGILAMGGHNQTLKGLQLKDGRIEASPVAPNPSGTTDAARAGQGVLTVNALGSATAMNGLGEFDVRKGTIQALLRGANNTVHLIKRTGGLVTLSYTGNHLLTGEVRIEAGRLVINGTMNGATLVVGSLTVEDKGGKETNKLTPGEFDLAGGNFTFGNVRLVSGEIKDSGKAPTTSGGARTYGSLTVNSGGKFDLRSGTVSAKLSGTGAALEKNNSGVANQNNVTLSNSANTYTGTTTVNNGRLTLTHGGALGTGTGNITVNSGGELALQGGITLTRNLTLAGGALLNLSGDNTLRGNLTLSGASTIQSIAGGLTVSGTLNLGANLTIKGKGSISLEGDISGSGDLTKGEDSTADDEDDGELRLLGNNNAYTGNITVNHGTLSVGHRNALGTTAGNTTTVASGATLKLALTGTHSLGENLRLAGAGVLGGADGTTPQGALHNESGNNTLTGNITLTGNTTIRSEGAGNTLKLSGVISHASSSKFGLTKTGAGKLTLTGTNTYTGATNVEQGELELANTTPESRTNQGAIYNDSNVILTRASGVKLTITNSEKIGSLTNAGGDLPGEGDEVNIAPNQRLTLGGGDYAGVISGGGGTGGGLTITGNTTLSGANTYAGTTEVGGGNTLTIKSSTALGATGEGNGTIVRNGSTLELEPFMGESLNIGESLTLYDNATLESGRGNNIWSGPITLAGLKTRCVSGSVGGSCALIFVNDAGRLEILGNISSSSDSTGGLEKRLGGLLILSGNNTYLGLTKVTGGTLRISKSGALGMGGGEGNGTLVNAILELTNGVRTPRNESLTLAGGTLKAWNSDVTWRGNITLTADSELAAEAAFQTSSTPTGAHLRITGNITNGGHTLTLNAVGAAVDNTLAPLVVLRRAASQITSSGVISGTGSLIKFGGGKATLTGANTYTGDTEIRDGELVLARADGATLNASSDVFIYPDGTAPEKSDGTGSKNPDSKAKLTIRQNETIASLAGGGEVVIDSGRTLTVKNTAGTNTNYGGLIRGAGNLVKGAAAGDTGTLKLSGNNTYAGTTTVNAGKLAIAHNNALGGTTGANSGTTVNSGGTLELQGRLTRNLADEITGQTNLNVAEPLTLNGGTLRNLHGFNKWSGPITLAVNSIIDSHRDEDTVVKTIPATPDCPPPVRSRGCPAA